MGGGRNEIPFQSSTNVRYHMRSDQNARLRRIGCRRTRCIGSPRSRWSIRPRNERPERTTLHAWCRTPMRDSSSRRLQHFLSPHSARRIRRRWSLSCGRRSWEATVSTSMPKYVRQVIGPSRLWSAIGTPRWAHVWLRIDSASEHSTE